MKMETEFDERVGGEIRARMGDEMVPIAKLTAWDPPRKFASLNDNAFGPESPAMACEWTVEAKDGDTCVVRLVQTLFAEDDCGTRSSATRNPAGARSSTSYATTSSATRTSRARLCRPWRRFRARRTKRSLA